MNLTTRPELLATDFVYKKSSPPARAARDGDSAGLETRLFLRSVFDSFADVGFEHTEGGLVTLYGGAERAQ